MTATMQSLAHLPTGTWAAVTGSVLVLTAATWGVTRRRVRSAGARSGGSRGDARTANVRTVRAQRKADQQRRRDVALTVASLVPVALFWGMVLAGSFQGLLAFGRSVLAWHGGTEYLVPGTLDGVSVTFAFLAFRAIHKRRDTGRSQRVVWAASVSSATVNFTYEYGQTHNVIAGLYLAVLSVFGMVIFHEFLAQFEEGAEYVRRSSRPAYGLRWLTAPWSTFRAIVAWENHPPADGTVPSVRNGLENLERVRQLRRNATAEASERRYERRLAAKQRKAELARIRKDSLSRGEEGAVLASDDPDGRDAVAAGAHRSLEVRTRPSVAESSGALRGASNGQRRVPKAVVLPRRAEVSVTVPERAAAVERWADTWVRMCADGNLVHGPLNDDEYARSAFQLSARQLRNIRNAALSGAIARRATELGIALPNGYTERPNLRINGHHV